MGQDARSAGIQGYLVRVQGIQACMILPGTTLPAGSCSLGQDAHSAGAQGQRLTHTSAALLHSSHCSCACEQV